MTNVETRQNRYRDGLESGPIRVDGLEGTRFDVCHLGVVPVGSSGRQVHGGPLEAGPWGYAVTHAKVIDRHGGSAVEREAAQRLAVGEPFTVDGLPGVWTFRSPNRRALEGDGPKLVSFEGPAEVTT